MTSSTAKSFLKVSPNLPKAVYFSNKKETPLLWQSMSLLFRDRVALGQVHKSEKKLINKYNIKDFPTIAVFKPPSEGQTWDDVEPLIFTGNSKKGTTVRAFLELHAARRLPGQLERVSFFVGTLSSFPLLHSQEGHIAFRFLMLFPPFVCAHVCVCVRV